MAEALTPSSRRILSSSGQKPSSRRSEAHIFRSRQSCAGMNVSVSASGSSCHSVDLGVRSVFSLLVAGTRRSADIAKYPLSRTRVTALVVRCGREAAGRREVAEVGLSAFGLLLVKADADRRTALGSADL